MGRTAANGDADVTARNSNNDLTSIVAITQCRNNEQINDVTTNGLSLTTIATTSTAVDYVQLASDARLSVATSGLHSATNDTKSLAYKLALLKHEF